MIFAPIERCSFLLHQHDMSSGLFLKFHILNLSVKIWDYWVYIGLYAPSVRSCKNYGQSDNRKVALIGSKWADRSTKSYDLLHFKS